MRTRLLYGFGFLLCLRGEYAEALAVAERAEALSSATNDPVLMSQPCTVHGDVDQLQGRWQSARAWLERGLALARAAASRRREKFRGRSAGRAPWAARRPAASAWTGRAGTRLAWSARTLAPESWDSRWRGLSRSGTARCSKCGWATPSVSPRLPTKCARSSRTSRWGRTQWLPVVSRLGGRANGPAARGLSRHPRKL